MSPPTIALMLTYLPPKAGILTTTLCIAAASSPLDSGPTCGETPEGPFDPGGHHPGLLSKQEGRLNNRLV